MSGDNAIVQAFLNSTTETLSTMALIHPVLISTEPWVGSHEFLECLASMGLCGKDEGLVVISVEKDVCRKVVAAMLGMGEDEVEEQLGDGLAEVLNMIAGSTKTQLSGTDHHFDLSIPMAVTGHKSTLSEKPGVPGVLIRLELEGAPMLLGVWMQGVVDS